MKASIVSWKDGLGWTRSKGQRGRSADLVFYFGATDILKSSRPVDEIRQMLVPTAQPLAKSA